MSLPIVIVTNSDYSYLWPILNDLYRDFDNVVVCLDKSKDFHFSDTFRLLFYDTNLNYTRRMHSILNQISEEFIYLTHDVDLLISCDKQKLENYLDVMRVNGLDRISMGLFTGSNTILHGKEVQVCKLDRFMSRNFYTPLDHAPSLYRTTTLKSIYEKYPNETYQSFEQNHQIQDDIAKNYKFFGINNHPALFPVYHRGFVFSSEISILHITVQGKLLPRNFYFDLEKTLAEIITRYDLSFLETHRDCGTINKQEIT